MHIFEIILHVTFFARTEGKSTTSVLLRHQPSQRAPKALSFLYRFSLGWLEANSEKTYTSYCSAFSAIEQW